MIIEAVMIAAAALSLPTDDKITVIDNTLPICNPDDGSKQDACIDILADGTKVVRVNYGKISMEA